jgi:ADP-heptose:LPS heptosyltransferase
MQEVINSLKDKYLFINLCNELEPKLGNALNFDRQDLRQCLSIIANADLVVTIDTYSLHAAAALKKKVIVLWGATSPITLGYNTHINLVKKACITPSCGRPNSFLSDTNPDGSPWSCPWGATCLDYTAEEIVKKIEENI